ncbi:MAG TPA: ABC transporter permease [Natronosporangium sp.]
MAVVTLGTFVRLKLRLLGNGLRGRPARVWLFVAGGLFALYLAGVGFLLFAVSGVGDPQVRLLVASYGGAALVLGSTLLPLVWFGIDDTLDPARFALLPLGRWRLVLGLFAAALLSVPSAALLLATTGLLVPVGRHGGAGAVAAQLVGLLAGLLLCVAAGRAVTSAFATMLRSRRVRDLAGVLLAALAALLGPAQLAIISATQNADLDQLTTAARVVGWTPLGAPYTIGIEVAEGRPVAALAKLAITGAAIAGLLWWWTRSLESAMVGAATAGPARADRPARGGPVSQLFPRLVPGLPATGFGAIVAREVRYWWRDAKRRANVISITVVGVLVPVIVTAGGGRITLDFDGEGFVASASPTMINVTVLFVGAFAAAMLANQFGFDGSSYAAHLIAGVPGGRELRARAIGHAILIVPVLVLVSVVAAAMLADPAVAPAAAGVVFAGYGAGVAVNTFVSVLAAYPLPETANPFATATGSGLAKSLLALVAMVAASIIAAPVLAIAAALGDAWPWLAVPIGAAYGAGAAALGCYLAGDVLDRRAPELLAAVTPSR